MQLSFKVQWPTTRDESEKMKGKHGEMELPLPFFGGQNGGGGSPIASRITTAHGRTLFDVHDGASQPASLAF